MFFRNRYMTDLVEKRRLKKTIPGKPSREKGQRSLDIPYIHRFAPPLMYPYWERAEYWRGVVRRLPVAMDCREMLISYMTSLDWKIEPTEPDMRDELKDDIEYYTNLFEAGGDYERSGWDFSNMVDWLLQDYLDTPFGGVSETIREGDKPEGKVLKIIPIDSASCLPTSDKDYPVVQKFYSDPTNLVVFPYWAINRMYMSPRTDIRFEGWGMPPPEKIYLAVEMLRRGDLYYSKFLSDTPEAGLLDLLDMDRASAEEWANGFKELFTGIDPFKIPVLYEHERPAQWIPFGKNPHELQFERAYHQYAVLVCAGYGLTPTDIGFPSVGGGGGSTLAGSIRDEKRTRRSGISRTKDKLRYWFNRVLPKSLRFVLIDLDDEVSVALSRARLANATAMGQYIDTRVFTPNEARQQTIADGLFNIPLPEDVPEDGFEMVEDKDAPERPGMLGAPIAPSQGGQGEVLNRNKAFGELLLSVIELSDAQIRKAAKAIVPVSEREYTVVLNELQTQNDFDWWLQWHNEALWGDLTDEIPELTALTISLAEKELGKIIRNEDWLSIETQNVTRAVNELVDGFRVFRKSEVVSRSIVEYESGKSETYVESIEDDKELEKQFKSDIRAEIRQFMSELTLAKPIIAGVRNSIIKTGLVELLDNPENMGDNIYVVDEVHKELAKFYVKSLQEFDTIVNRKSYSYLEEDANE